MTPVKSRSRAKRIATWVGTVISAIMIGGGGGVYVVGILMQPSVDIRAILTESMPNPTNHGRFQILVVRNEGKKPAATALTRV